MRKFLKPVFAISVMLAAIAPASAASVVLNFPDPASIVVSLIGTGPLGGGGAVRPGRVFRTGDSVSQSFSATGLANADNARFVFGMSNFTSVGVVGNFDVFINGIDVGDYAITSTAANNLGRRTDFDLSFAFAPIAGDSYTLMLRMKNTVASGRGSFNWFNDGRVTLSNSVIGPGVPEPATWAMMIFGFGAVGGAMRRRSALTISTKGKIHA